MKQPDPLSALLIEHVRWYVKLRWLYIISLGVAWLGGQIVFNGWSSDYDSDVILLVVGLLVNALFQVLANKRGKSIQYYYRLAIAEIAADITTASIVLFEHGGVAARTIILYSIPIFVAGALFGNATLLLTIIASAIAYDATIVFHALTHDGLSALTGEAMVLIAFYNTVFIMIGLVAKHSLDKTTEALQKRNQELLAFNEAKDDFISIASHQLRTPATAVKQYLGMMQQGYFGKLSKEQKDTLEKAYISNERQLKIVNDLLQVARLDTENIQIKKARHDLVKLIKDVAQDQKPEFDSRNQSLKLELPDKPVAAHYDLSLMRMVLENIINNASKYSHEDSTVTVALRTRRRNAEITVVDSGIGISRRERSKLFKKFSRVSHPLSGDAGGSGLGLYWAKKIIDLHHGDIDVTSRKRSGSTFTVILPMH